jgi:hemoglobin
MKSPKETRHHEDIEGLEMLQAVTDAFYSKVKEDERVNYFFRWVDLKQQSCKMQEFLAHALGATKSYSGKSLGSAHGHLMEIGLNQGHFNIIKKHLSDSFLETGVSSQFAKTIEDMVEQFRKSIFIDNP